MSTCCWGAAFVLHSNRKMPSFIVMPHEMQFFSPSKFRKCARLRSHDNYFYWQQRKHRIKEEKRLSNMIHTQAQTPEWVDARACSRNWTCEFRVGKNYASLSDIWAKCSFRRVINKTLNAWHSNGFYQYAPKPDWNTGRCTLDDNSIQQ